MFSTGGFGYNETVVVETRVPPLMKADPLLMIPGPTPVPNAVLEVLARPPIGHRSEAFKAILKEVYAGLQWVFQTQQPVFLYTASGTGAMEAALVNTLNPGDEILVLACGVFSLRWAEIARELGLVVHLQEVPAGSANSAADLEAFLKSPYGPTLKAVCMIHSETSTGVLNPIAQLAQVVRAHSDALVIVDTVTGLGAAPLLFDEWGLDIAVSGSQKGFMIPPGLAFLAASERAMAAHRQCRAPGYYFNFTKSEKNVGSGQTPYTPAINLTCGLQKALELMQADGLDELLQRHRKNQRMVRQAARAMGLSLFVKSDDEASLSVTSIVPPEGVSVDAIRAAMREQFSITIANGQKELAGKIFRIGHLGAVFPRDVFTVIAALEMVLHQLGYDQTPLGAGVAATQEVLLHG